MTSVAMSGADTFVLNNRILTDFPDGDVVILKFPNEKANVKTGKNGNSIYGYNASGQQCEAEIRILRGSNDDKWLNNLMAQQDANFAAFPLMQGAAIKKIGDGAGNVSNDMYILSGGVFNKGIEMKSNVEGDTGQSVALYSVKFSVAPRVIA